MHMTPDVERQRRLKLDGFQPGWTVVFCSRCDFQLPPQSAGYPQCRCGAALHLTKVTIELIALTRGIQCPRCGSNKVSFDPHAGFASCWSCHLDSEREGEGLFRIGAPLYERKRQEQQGP